jgi:hypothetical protein
MHIHIIHTNMIHKPMNRPTHKHIRTHMDNMDTQTCTYTWIDWHAETHTQIDTHENTNTPRHKCKENGVQTQIVHGINDVNGM